MFGRELLMALAQRQRLRGLDEAARPFGVFLEIHTSLPRPNAALVWRTPKASTGEDVGVAAAVWKRFPENQIGLILEPNQADPG